MKQHTRHDTITSAQLEKLIRRYFDAETDESEERFLREVLATPSVTSPSADEARAVMGIFAAQRTAGRRGILRRRLTHAAAAAAVIVAVAVSLTFIATRPASPTAGTDILTAWHNGTQYGSPDDVMAIMDSNLAMLGEASDDFTVSVSDDLAELGELLDDK